jgi:hypothetical protein
MHYFPYGQRTFIGCLTGLVATVCAGTYAIAARGAAPELVYNGELTRLLTTGVLVEMESICTFVESSTTRSGCAVALSGPVGAADASRTCSGWCDQR